MGILNVTPDSFYDGGKFSSEMEIVSAVEKMILDGATIIDVGAVSTRPDSIQINSEEEIKRLKPAFSILQKMFPDTWFSLDTYRSNVAKMAVEEYGFGMINDISAGKFDNKMFTVISGLKIPYIIMHMQGTPENMQHNPVYSKITPEIISNFSEILNELKQLGVNDVLIDPGFGFGKTIEHNYKLLKELTAFKIFELPIVVGVSRKSMIYKLLQCSADDALNGTSIVNTLALINGADILRVHDVKQAVEALKIVELYKNC
ncbi:MAG: dihydropteroate synthase [Bacteroidia bacterium]|nr:dihydropteroate synthase [Bacteroidia bacterium]